MATELPQLPHLQMVNRGIAQDYKSRPGRGPTVNTPPRNRATHGTALRNQLQAFVPIAQNRQLQREAMQLDQLVPDGITIEFQSAHGFDLAFKSLNLPSAGIELLNVKEVNGVTYATCYVPEGKLEVLITKVRQYIEQTTLYGKPRNQALVAGIESIGLATIDAFWTDEVPPPKDNAVRWWEVWLRRREDLAAEATLQRFNSAAEVLGFAVAETWLEFPDRVVTMLEASRTQLAQAVELLNLFAEIRRADLAPLLPHEPNLHQQDAFVNDLAARLQPPDNDAVTVTLLDTGVNRGHPLLAPALAPTDVLTANAAWGVHDHDGHGTQMAGIALYGDLRDWQGSTGPVQLGHRLESVKLIGPIGGPVTPPALYGALTEQAVHLSENHAPERKRIFCKTVTSPMHQDGVPSSYSAAVDQLACGDDEHDPRLIVVSAGNVPDALWPQWANSNVKHGVEQPGQAWNALTVGAWTNMATLPGGNDWAGWSPIAPAGELSPFSSTSCAWLRWPVKPEVVFEGGNAAMDVAGQTALPLTMQLITTHRAPHASPLTHTCMTSPATAQGSRLSARIATAYPDYWPESLKAMVVHHARWTPQQRARFFTEDTALGRAQLLRACGWGVPNERAAVNSVRNRVCIVAQESVQPYKLQGSKGAMNEMRIFALPWPKGMLTAMANTAVRLRVTLCYFIEPSPSKRGWLNRYRYGSHFLRFDLRRNNESIEAFNKRVNAAMLEKDEEIDAPTDDGWFLRSKLRTYGSIHSDEWTGMAVNLMSRDLIAVYPVVGWWRECPERGCCEKPARFSLILSLEADDNTVDLYTAIQTELATPIAVELINELGTD